MTQQLIADQKAEHELELKKESMKMHDRSEALMGLLAQQTLKFKKKIVKTSTGFKNFTDTMIAKVNTKIEDIRIIQHEKDTQQDQMLLDMTNLVN